MATDPSDPFITIDPFDALTLTEALDPLAMGEKPSVT